VILLSLAKFSPTILPSLNETLNPRAEAAKDILKLQSVLQAFTSIGHIIPNPRMIFSQELSIVLSFTLLCMILRYTTPKRIYIPAGWKVVTALCIVPLVMFVTIGLLPVIYISCFAAIACAQYFKGAFSLVTPSGNRILLVMLLSTLTVLAVETLCCNGLQDLLGKDLPYHLVFDICFWQVIGSALDVVVCTPTPSKFMYADDDDEEDERVVRGEGDKLGPEGEMIQGIEEVDDEEEEDKEDDDNDDGRERRRQ
jgi:hypothetical protein